MNVDHRSIGLRPVNFQSRDLIPRDPWALEQNAILLRIRGYKGPIPVLKGAGTGLKLRSNRTRLLFFNIVASIKKN